MSKRRARAEAVAALIRNYESVNVEFVQETLGCGRSQARVAIRQARLILAEEGYRVSYATANNEYEVSADGDADVRARSYGTRMQSIITQTKNAAKVTRPSLNHPNASKEERFIARQAEAAALRAEAEEQSLMALRELLGS